MEIRVGCRGRYCTAVRRKHPGFYSILSLSLSYPLTLPPFNTSSSLSFPLSFTDKLATLRRSLIFSRQKLVEYGEKLFNKKVNNAAQVHRVNEK